MQFLFLPAGQPGRWERQQPSLSEAWRFSDEERGAPSLSLHPSPLHLTVKQPEEVKYGSAGVTEGAYWWRAGLAIHLLASPAPSCGYFSRVPVFSFGLPNFSISAVWGVPDVATEEAAAESLLTILRGRRMHLDVKISAHLQGVWMSWPPGDIRLRLWDGYVGLGENRPS